MIPDRNIGLIWTLAIALAALATWICFDAIPGINWPIWTAAAAGALIYAAARRTRSRLVDVTAMMAVAISIGTAITASEVNIMLILLSVICLLAMSMLLVTRPDARRITAWFAATAPIVAITNVAISSVTHAAGATTLIRSPRARVALRAAALTLPVVVIFGLLLSVADPTFALWRDSIEEILTTWDFLPRTVFFVMMLLFSLGVYGYAVNAPDSEQPAPSASSRFLGSGERLVLITSVAALLWLFLALQLSYLFGNLPEVPGSGVTFAEYARRGFGEMTIVAAATVLLIVLSERFGVRDERSLLTRMVTFALIAAVLLLLVSAFNRVVLYEDAYGYTTARLYAQLIIVLVAVALLALGVEVAGELDAGRLFRRAGVGAFFLLLVITFWNHEAWIAHRNIDRFATTGKLDADYLVRDLSPNAVPAVIAALPSLPEPTRSALQQLLVRRYPPNHPIYRDRRWFEWNLRYQKAREALTGLGVS
jgi:two-component system sensor histidine kinase BaeS